MTYILHPHIALRSWWKVPYTYYVQGERNAKKLTKEDYELLCLCDGQHELSPTPLLEGLLRRGLAVPCHGNTNTLLPRQICRCDNRYFPAMNWMITGKCNYNCLHCFNAADNSPLMSEFTWEEAQRLLDEAADCGIHALTITGGEPMCHKHFFDILEGTYRRGLYVEELNTNGHYIDQTVLDRMKAIGCRPLIKISFDGLHHHDWLRNRKGAEEDALRAIKLCIDNGFRVKVQTNVHRRNPDTLLPTARLLEETGVAEMRIIRTTEVPRWNENARGATLLLEEYFEAMLRFVGEFIKEDHRMAIDIWQFLALFPRLKNYRMRTVECGIGQYRDSLPVCRGNRGMVAIAANGNVFPCMQMSGYYEAHGDIPGNVKTDGLQSLLQSGRYPDEVCTTVGDLKAANPACAACEYFTYCVGGCRAIALTLTGDKLGVDPSKCLFFKKGYVEKTVSCLSGWNNVSPME